jgi:membrane-associated protease RseP (regulator of RpoE activity)
MNRRRIDWSKWIIILFFVVFALGTPLWRFLPLMIFVLVVCQLIPFAIAKRTGVRLQEVVFGIGPCLVDFELGDVRYVFNALPVTSTLTFGGLRGWRDLAFRSSAVLSALGFAIVFLSLSFAVGGHVPTSRVEVLSVTTNSTAGIAGVQSGDIMRELGRQVVTSKWQVENYLRSFGGGEIKLILLRESKLVSTTMLLKSPLTTQQSVGWEIRTEPELKVFAVETDSPAASAGIRVNDVILKMDGYDVNNAFGFIKYVSDKKGKEINVVLRRGETIMSPVPMTPRAKPAASQGPLGVTLGTDISAVALSWPEAIQIGMLRTAEMVVTVFTSFIAPTGYDIYPMSISLLREDPSAAASLELLSFICVSFFVISSIAVVLPLIGGNIPVQKILAGVIIAMLLLSYFPLSFLDPLRVLTSGNFLGIGNIVRFRF